MKTIIKKNTWITKDLIGFSLTSLFNDFNHEMTTSLLPTFVEQLIGPANTPIALGLIMGFADAASTFMKLLSGWLADHIKYFKPVLIIGYTITPVFVCLIGTATHIWQVFIYQTLAWMGRGLREPIRDVWLANISSANNYGKVFGFERAFDTIGAIAGPTLAFFTIKLWTIKYNFFIAFIPGFISILTIIFLTSNYKRPIRNTELNTNWKNQISNLPSNFKYFVFIMFIFGIANFNKTLLIFRAQEMLLGSSSSSIIATGIAISLYILFNVIRSIAEFSIGSLSDYINRKILLSFFGFGTFALTTVILVFAKTQILLWIIIFICAGFSAGTVSSVEKSYAAQLLPENTRGTGFGFLQSIDGVGDLLSSVIVGGLWSFISPEIAFIYSTILSILSSVLLFRIRK